MVVNTSNGPDNLEDIRKKGLRDSKKILTSLSKSLNVLCYGNTHGEKTNSVHLGMVLNRTLNLLDSVDFQSISSMDNLEAKKLFRNMATAYNIRMSDLRDKLKSDSSLTYSSKDALLANSLKDRISQLGKSLDRDVMYVETRRSMGKIMEEDKSKEVTDIDRYVGLNEYQAIQRENIEKSIETKIVARDDDDDLYSNGGNNGSNLVVDVRDRALERHPVEPSGLKFISGLKGWGRKVKETISEKIENSRGYLSGWKEKLAFA